MHSWAEECDTVTLWQLSESGLRRSSRLVSQLSCIYGTMTGNTCLGMKTSPSSSPSTWSSSSQSSKIRSPALLDLWQWHQEDSEHMFGHGEETSETILGGFHSFNITKFLYHCLFLEDMFPIIRFQLYCIFQDIYWRVMIWMMMRKRMMNCGLSCLQPITQFKIAFLFWPQGPPCTRCKDHHHHHLQRSLPSSSSSTTSSCFLGFWRWRERCLCSSLWPTTKALSQILWCKRSMRLGTAGQ